MRKHIFLLASIGMLTFMALTTEKKVLVTTGYAITEEELALGREIYQHSCRDCHEKGVDGAPSVARQKDWDAHLAGGVAKLLRKEAPQCLRGLDAGPGQEAIELSRQEIEAATAFMIRQSRQ
jgi:cytochrome c5